MHDGVHDGDDEHVMRDSIQICTEYGTKDNKNVIK